MAEVSPKADPGAVGQSNAGLRLLDACLDDVAYARALLNSKRADDLEIRTKVNWREFPSGNSLLHILVFSDLSIPVGLLIQHKADVNIRNKWDETPLHWCAKRNAAQCASLLLGHPKVLKNCVDTAKNTPLHYAIHCNHLEIAVLLLSHHADISIHDKDGCDALELSLRQERTHTTMGPLTALLLRAHHQRELPISATATRVLRQRQWSLQGALALPEQSSEEIQRDYQDKLIKEKEKLLLLRQLERELEPPPPVNTSSVVSEQASPSVDVRSPMQQSEVHEDPPSLTPPPSFALQSQPEGSRSGEAEQSPAVPSLPLLRTQSTEPPPQTRQSAEDAMLQQIVQSLSSLQSLSDSLRQSISTQQLQPLLMQQQQQQSQQMMSPKARGNSGSPNTRQPPSPMRKYKSTSSLGASSPSVSPPSRRRREAEAESEVKDTYAPPRTLRDMLHTGDLRSPKETARDSARRSNTPAGIGGIGGAAGGGGGGGVGGHHQSTGMNSVLNSARGISSPASVASSHKGQDKSFFGGRTGNNNNNNNANNAGNNNGSAVPSTVSTTLTPTHAAVANPVPKPQSAQAKSRQPSIGDPSQYAQQQQLVLAMMAPEEVVDGSAPAAGYNPPPPTHLLQQQHQQPSFHQQQQQQQQYGGGKDKGQDKSNQLDLGAPGGMASALQTQKIMLHNLMSTLPALDTIAFTEQQFQALQHLPYCANGSLVQQKQLYGTVTSLQKEIKGQLALIKELSSASKESAMSQQQVAQQLSKLKLPHVPASIKKPDRRGPRDEKKDASSSILTEKYPSAELVPFLPDFAHNHASDALGDLSPDHLDVFVAVEHCFDCHTHASLSLRHDTKKYVSNANTVLSALVQAIAASKLAVRVFALRTSPLAENRLGAFEVTVAVRLSLPPPATAQPLGLSGSGGLGAPSSGAIGPGGKVNPLLRMATVGAIPSSQGLSGLFSASGAAGDTSSQQPEEEDLNASTFLRRWATTTLHSKLATKSWPPSMSTMQQRCLSFLEAAISEVVQAKNMYNSPSSMFGGPSSLFGSSPAAQVLAPSSNTALHPMLEFRHASLSASLERSIMEQYAAWTQRMRVPPLVERHHLDTDWPTLNLSEPAPSPTNGSRRPPGVKMLTEIFLNGSQDEGDGETEVERDHPAGPMLDHALAAQLSQSPFEKAVLKHFLVFDARLPQHSAKSHLIMEDDDEQ